MADKWADTPEGQSLKGKVKQAFSKPSERESRLRAFAHGAASGARIASFGKGAPSLGAMLTGLAGAACISGMIYGYQTAETIEENTQYAPLVAAQAQPGSDIADPAGFMLHTQVRAGERSYEYVLSRTPEGFGLYRIEFAYGGMFGMPRDPRLEAVTNIEEAAYASHVMAQALGSYSGKLNSRDQAISPSERPSIRTVGTLSIPYDYDFTPREDDVRYIIEGGESMIRAGADVSDQYAAVAAVWAEAAAHFEAGRINAPVAADPRPEETVVTVTTDYGTFNTAAQIYGGILGGQLLLILGGGAMAAAGHRRKPKPAAPKPQGPSFGPSFGPTTEP